MIDTVYSAGSCALGHGSGRRLLARDRDGSRFRFAPIGGALFREDLSEAERAGLPDAIVVRTADGRLLVRSAAALEIASRLGGASAFFARGVRLVPAALRDALYDLVARTRYRLFGRTERECPVIAPELRARFDLRP